MIFWLQCYAFFWMLLTGYMSFTLLDKKRRIDKANDLLENGHIYETLLASLSPQILVGILVAMQLFMVAVDLYGFLLAVSYVPFAKWQELLFGAVVICDVYESLKTFFTLKKFRRIFNSADPFKLLARYMRYYTYIGSATGYVSTYGKCFIAVNLFLHLQSA